mmetsp:Transcript_62117/g.171796  ORF Transcript_62117/g.171796 Transcript_62117/m.171796 type:complete len:249 (-) Transcript_62117:149-895(-)
MRRPERLAALALLRSAGAQPQLRQLDQNGDGVIDKIELFSGTKDMLDLVGEADKERRNEVYDTVGALYEASDIDGNGVLSGVEIEFAELLSRMHGELGQAHAVEFHKYLDEDQDGSVDPAEFRRIAGRGARSEGLEAALALLFRDADVDGDGGLTVLECQYATLRFIDDTGIFAASVPKDVHKSSTFAISKEELAAGIEAHAQDQSPEAELLRRALAGFDFADVNGDGRLDEDEAKALLDVIFAADFS